MNKVTDGEISITFPHGGREEIDYVNIAITDIKSGTEFLEIRVPYASFTRALSSSAQECGLIIRNLERIGKTQEIKRMNLPKPTFDRNDKEKLKEYLQPYEIDGWVCKSDVFNHHLTGFDVVHATFVRWV